MDAYVPLFTVHFDCKMKVTLCQSMCIHWHACIHCSPTVLPATHALIHEWYEPYLPLPYSDVFGWQPQKQGIVRYLWRHFYSLSEKATQKHPKWQNRTSDREPDGRFWIGKPRFLFEFPSNHMSISLSSGDIRMWLTDGRTTRIITTAGLHIVAAQLIKIGSTQ